MERQHSAVAQPLGQPTEVGGFTVGHFAKMNRCFAVAVIKHVEQGESGPVITLEFEQPQLVDAPAGATSTRFIVDWRSISSTWAPYTVADTKPPC